MTRATSAEVGGRDDGPPARFADAGACEWSSSRPWRGQRTRRAKLLRREAGSGLASFREVQRAGVRRGPTRRAAARSPQGRRRARGAAYLEAARRRPGTLSWSSIGRLRRDSPHFGGGAEPTTSPDEEGCRRRSAPAWDKRSAGKGSEIVNGAPLLGCGCLSPASVATEGARKGRINEHHQVREAIPWAIPRPQHTFIDAIDATYLGGTATKV